MKKLIALLTLCALLAGCAGAAPAQSDAGSGGDASSQSAAAPGPAASATEAPAIDWDSLPEHPPFDYFTVSYYNSRKSRIYAEDNEIGYFLAEELYFMLHRAFGTKGDWQYGDTDWTLFENVSKLDADRPVFKEALEVPDPIRDLQWEFVETETPWVKFVWSENRRVSAEGEVYALEDYMAPGDTVQTIRYIAVFLECPEEEDRLDCVVFEQNPETGEYISWDARTMPELGIWFRQELFLYSWYEIL